MKYMVGNYMTVAIQQMKLVITGLLTLSVSKSRNYSVNGSAWLSSRKVICPVCQTSQNQEVASDVITPEHYDLDKLEHIALEHC